MCVYFSVLLKANEQANLQDLLDAFFVVSDTKSIPVMFRSNDGCFVLLKMSAV